MVDITLIKAQIRALLNALGRRTTEKEFRREYYEQEGESFNNVLSTLGFRSALELFHQIPDVCRVFVGFDGELFIEKVSHEGSAHLDHLTKAQKKRKKSKGFRPLVHRFMPPMAYNRQPPIVQRYPRPVQNRSYPHQVYRPPAARAPIQNHPLRPVNSMARPRPPPKLVELPPHLRPGVEQAHYKPANTPSTDENTTPAPPPTPAEPEIQPGARVEVKPSIFSRLGPKLEAPHLSANVEKAVYKPTEKVFYKGDQKEVHINLDESWVDVEPAKNDKTNASHISISSETSSSSSSSSPSVKLQSNQKYERLENPTFAKVSRDNSKPRTPTEIRAHLSLTHRLRELSLDTADENLVKTADIKLPPIKLVESETNFFNITLLKIETPAKFTFQFDNKILGAMQSSLKIFYDNFRTVAKDLKVNMLAVAENASKYYRVKVLSFDDALVTVLPVDFHTIEPRQIPREKIFYIHKQFCTNSPMSAIGKIFGAKPKDGEWHEEAKAELEKLRLKTDLRATVRMKKHDVYLISIIVNNATRRRFYDTLFSGGYIVFDITDFNDAKGEPSCRILKSE